MQGHPVARERKRLVAGPGSLRGSSGFSRENPAGPVPNRVARPAVAIARALSDTFSGIRPIDAPGFIIAQCIGALIAAALMRWLLTDETDA